MFIENVSAFSLCPYIILIYNLKSISCQIEKQEKD